MLTIKLTGGVEMPLLGVAIFSPTAVNPHFGLR